QVEPVLDIPGMSQLARYAEVGAEKCGCQFPDQLLGRIGACAEAAGEVAVETGFVSRPMTEFMQRGRVVLFDRCERADRRQVDEVERRNETGPVAAVPDFGVRRRDEGVDRRVPLGLGRERAFRNGEAVDLRDIEDRVLAQHGSLLDLVVLALEDERFGEDDMRAAFALAHVRALIERLLERHPGVTRISVGIRARPEDRDIDPAVRSAGRRIGRHDAACAVAIGFPRAHPWNHAALHLFDDGACDVLVNPHLSSPAQSTHRTGASSGAGEGTVEKITWRAGHSALDNSRDRCGQINAADRAHFLLLSAFDDYNRPEYVISTLIRVLSLMESERLDALINSLDSLIDNTKSDTSDERAYREWQFFVHSYRHDWRPVWALCNEIQDGFSDVRYIRAAQRQESWLRFCHLRNDASRAANVEREDFQTASLTW